MTFNINYNSQRENVALQYEGKRCLSQLLELEALHATPSVRALALGRSNMAHASRVGFAREHQTSPSIAWRSVFVPAARRRKRSSVAVLAVGGALLFMGCYGKESERLTCDDVLPAGSFEFQNLVVLVNDQEKGCLAECHSAEAQEAGIRLDTAKLVYEEFSQRPDLFYAMVASGEMPEEGTRWSEDDLLQFRSWYCAGAFPP